jgi:hypothetical protein
MDEVSEPESRSGSLEGEVAKWQNRVIPFLANSQVPERMRVSGHHGEMLLRLV